MWTFPKLGTRSPIPQAAAGYCPQTEERDRRKAAKGKEGFRAGGPP
jgi:hypothetical protein